MIWNIIGCGESAQHWQGHGLSIGVNDCEKIGHRVGTLVLANFPEEFKGERLETIVRTSAAKIYSWDTGMPAWKKIFGERLHELQPLRRWHGVFAKDKPYIYHSDTSPFIAMTLAFRLGASELVLWGVDFQTHHIYKPGNVNHASEVERYQKLAFQMKQAGCPVYLGVKGSVLQLPVKPRL